MRKRFVLAVILAASGIVAANAQSVGGGVSVWVPESLYLDRGGSVGVETALGSSVGLGSILSLPFGVVYNKVYGLLPESAEGLPTAPRPWFVADTFVLHASLMVTVPIGPLYAKAFGGGAGGWNATLVPLVGNIAADLAADGQLVVFDGGMPTITDGRWGYGWIAGGAVGITIDQIAIDLNATYRLLRYDVTVAGDVFRIDAESGAFIADEPVSIPNLVARLAGVSIGINARFSF